MSAPAAALAAAMRIRRQLGWEGTAPPGAGPALILLGGLPGTGKSHLAQLIAQQHPAVVVRSDEVRKLLYRRPSYSPAESGFVYLTCYALLRSLLTDGYIVIFDATNLARGARRRARAIARLSGAPALVVMTTAPPGVVAARLARRAAGESEAFSSAADWAVYERMAPALQLGGTYEPVLVVDTSQSLAPALAAVARFLSTRDPFQALLPAPAPPPDSVQPSDVASTMEEERHR